MPRAEHELAPTHWDRCQKTTGTHGEPIQRTVIIHYHLFKNAGTSVDEMLRHNFGQRWSQHEFPGAGGKRSNTEAVGRHLAEHRELVALSSHTAHLPVPALDGVRAFPIIFIRHPIDRLRSAYIFERGQLADTFGAKLAKEHDFAGYLRVLLDPQRRRQGRNFQTYRLAMNESQKMGSELDRAMNALQLLPFVGLVEAFDRSIERLENLLKSFFPSFAAVKAHKNASYRLKNSLRERLRAIKQEIGSDLYKELRTANADDLKIYRTLKARYESNA